MEILYCMSVYQIFSSPQAINMFQHVCHLLCIVLSYLDRIKKIEVNIVEICVGLLQELQHLGIPCNMTNARGMYLIPRVTFYHHS